MAINDLAVTFARLGRHPDAHAMAKKTLDLFRRVLPENHPYIGDGDACYEISCF